MSQEERGTGKTQRMLEQAVDAARVMPEGEVLVVVASWGQAMILGDRILELAGGDRSVADRITVVAAYWTTEITRGRNYEKVFVDHYAMDSRTDDVCDMMLRLRVRGYLPAKQVKLLFVSWTWVHDLFWVRVLGWGLHFTKRPPLFSERTGLKRVLRLWGGWRVSFLPRGKP